MKNIMLQQNGRSFHINRAKDNGLQWLNVIFLTLISLLFRTKQRIYKQVSFRSINTCITKEPYLTTKELVHMVLEQKPSVIFFQTPE